MKNFRWLPLLGIWYLLVEKAVAEGYDPKWFSCATAAECTLVPGDHNCGFVGVNRAFAEEYSHLIGAREATDGAACLTPDEDEVRNTSATCINGGCVAVRANEKKWVVNKKANTLVEKGVSRRKRY